MVRVIGPMMSMQARGTFGKQLTFSEAKKRPYARRRTIPNNPRSGRQVSIRAMLTFLSQQWSGLDAADKATFDAPALLNQVAPYHVFCGQSQARNRHFLGPQKTYQPTMTGGAPAWYTFTLTKTGNRTFLKISDDEDPSYSWGYLIYMAHVNPFTPSWDKLVAAVEADGMTPTPVEFHDLPPALYVYTVRCFTEDGSLGPIYPFLEIQVT